MEAKQVLKGHHRGHVAFSPDGRTLVSGGFSDALVYETASWQERRTLANTSTAWGLVFTPDGKRLAIIQPDVPVQMWDTRTWQVAEEVETGHKCITRWPSRPTMTGWRWRSPGVSCASPATTSRRKLLPFRRMGSPPSASLFRRMARYWLQQARTTKCACRTPLTGKSKAR